MSGSCEIKGICYNGFTWTLTFKMRLRRIEFNILKVSVWVYRKEDRFAPPGLGGASKSCPVGRNFAAEAVFFSLENFENINFFRYGFFED